MDAWTPESAYEMNPGRLFRWEKFSAAATDYRIKVKPLPVDRWHERMVSIFQSILDRIIRDAPPNAMGRVVIRIGGLQAAINFRASKLADLSVVDMLQAIEMALNSSEHADLGDPMTIHVIYASPLKGGAQGLRARPGPFRRRRHLNPIEWLKHMKCAINVAEHANDQMCLARVLAVGRYKADHPNLMEYSKEYTRLRDSRQNPQRDAAQQLCRHANVDETKPAGLKEIRKFQCYLRGYTLVVFVDGDHIIFEGPATDKPIYVYLAKDQFGPGGELLEGHYYLLNSKMMCAFTGTRSFCRSCHRGFNGEAERHQCRRSPCVFCAHIKCKNRSKQANPVNCRDCGRKFQTAACKRAHNGSICAKLGQCPVCELVLKRKFLPRDKHHCLEQLCRICGDYFKPAMHMHCKMQRHKLEGEEMDPAPAAEGGQFEADEPNMALWGQEEEEHGIEALLGDLDFERGYEDGDVDFGGEEAVEAGEGRQARPRRRQKRPKRPRKIYLADYESELHGDVHEPFLMCVRDEEGNRKAYLFPDCTEKFVNDLYNKEEFIHSLIIFHNYSGYDSQHILRHVYKHKIAPQLILRDSKVLTLTLPGCDVKMVDSFLHMPLALASMPRMFGFQNVAKSHFPYKLLTPENRAYVGPFPPLAMFDPDSLKTVARQKLIEWHARQVQYYLDHPDEKFDLAAVCRLYCQLDTDVLYEGCKRYRERMQEIFDPRLNPWDCITLPQFVNRAFRALYLEEDKPICPLPQQGYGKRKQSGKALCWMEYLRNKYNGALWHSRNSHEVRVGKYWVDGAWFPDWSPEHPILLEFMGCRWHGHNCLDEDPNTLFHGQTYAQRAEDTAEKCRWLRARGYEVIVMHECDWDAMKLEHDGIKKFASEFLPLYYNKNKTGAPLKPRDALKARAVVY